MNDRGLHYNILVRALCLRQGIMPMRVMLIQPPYMRLAGFLNNFYPLGLGYLGSSLLESGQKVRLCNLELSCLPFPFESERFSSHAEYLEGCGDYDHPAWRDLREELRRFRPDLVGISVTTTTYQSAVSASKLCKSENPSAKVIWGGPHATAVPRDVLRRVAEVDIVVAGEGEETMVELCAALEKGRDPAQVLGTWLRNMEKGEGKPPRPLAENLDQLPLPLRNREHLSFAQLYDNNTLGVVATSRGCPFDCAFCASRITWGRKVRWRSTDSVMEELRELASKHSVRYVEFTDDSFTARHAYVREIAQRISEEKVRIKWSCGTRADLITEDIIRVMHENGCELIYIGVESGSERLLEVVGKKATVERIKKGIDHVDKAGLRRCLFFMMGFPDETIEDLEMTRDLMTELGGQIVLSVFSPYPGTRLFEECRELGILPKEPDWSGYSNLCIDQYFAPSNPPEDFKRVAHEMIKIAETGYIRSGVDTLVLKKVRANLLYYLRHPIYAVRNAWASRRFILASMWELLRTPMTKRDRQVPGT